MLDPLWRYLTGPALALTGPGGKILAAPARMSDACLDSLRPRPAALPAAGMSAADGAVIRLRPGIVATGMPGGSRIAAQGRRRAAAEAAVRLPAGPGRWRSLLGHCIEPGSLTQGRKPPDSY